jgi:5-methylthioadenosine/S-adenosylhomocysteine deaminase
MYSLIKKVTVIMLFKGVLGEMSSILLKNGTILTMGKDEKIIDNGFITIENDKIVDLGLMKDLSSEENKDYDSIIDAKGKVILPGLINAHTHLATECFRGIADVYPYMHFTFVVKNFFEDHHLYELSLLGCLELLRFGTTCTGDNYQKSDIIAQSIYDSGMRGVLSEQISQADLLSGIYPAIYKYQPEEAEKSIKANDKLIDKWQGKDNNRITCTYGPHAPDTLTQDILKEIKEKADEKNVGLMVHIAQSLREGEMMRSRHGMTSVEYLDKAGILGPKTVGAHCVYLTQDDIETLRKTETHIAHCPNNFIRRGRATPLMPWLKGGIKNIGLASDNILHDPFEIMRFTNYLALQYVRHIDPNLVHYVPTSYETLKMATIGSAAALGLEREVGSIESGKKADIITVDFKAPHLVPNLDVSANLVHYANGNDVDTVIVDGRVLVENKKFLKIDTDSVYKKAQLASEKIWTSFKSEYPQFPEVADKLNLF